MKILFLSNSIGGLRAFRYELISALCMRGDTIFISSPIESSTDCFKQLGCKIIPTKMSQRGINPFSELMILKQYKQILQSIKPDIVLSYTIKPNIYGGVACRKLHIPLISSITGLGIAVENKGLLQKITIILYRWGMKKTNFVYFQNQDSMIFFNNHNIKLTAKSLIAGSGVNLDKFTYTEYPTTDNSIHFLFISRILGTKGIAQYLEAAKYHKKLHPETHFHIVGIRDDKYYSKIIDQLHEEGIIEYHGQQLDVRPYIAKSHCLIHPTFYPEGLSNVLLENAAMGRPAITTDKSGCREVVDDNITGFIVKQRDSQDLIKKIEQFINLPLERKSAMGLAAYNKVSQLFDRKKVVTQYINKIDELHSIS
ncbi:glycosyltransferase family 4 protein [Parabacteroides goldsteinii]|uniref:glycosyltransferase family 4 protein n=1 Tax=Parabacteroides goldsteinii TaxID=328812 RepID=UPI00189C1118|nr:glycosyltransferase family 4 protein [Parabacteroides goldsteinii]